MPAQNNDLVLIAYFFGAMLLSIATCLYLLAIRRRGPWLPFEPRQPVPWNFIGALPALLLVILTVGAAWENAARSGEEPRESQLYAGQMVAAIAQEVLIVGSILVLVVAGFNATSGDLGMPMCWRELARDVLVGLVAGIAMLAPVYLIMAYLMGPDAKSGHPLVRMLEAGPPDFTVLLLATFMAVVIAPVCEEITFRLLLQGWLERRKTLAVCRQATPEPAESGVIQSTASAPAEEILVTEPGNQGDVSGGLLSADGEFKEVTPHTVIVALEGFGWTPIAISSLLFALAHFGYGPDPIPLFFLAIVLGYLYFRTHRIVPSIVAHAVFNGFAMVQMWRMVFHGAH